MTQYQKILALLRKREPVTLGALFDAGVGYTGRNDISDMRIAGFTIGQRRGARPSLNAYLLVAEPGEVVDRGRVAELAAIGWKKLPPPGELFPEVGKPATKPPLFRPSSVDVSAHTG